MRQIPNKNKYARCHSIFVQFVETWWTWDFSYKMGFFDFFVYRWYKNFIED
jgi:hypothetical protein